MEENDPIKNLIDLAKKIQEKQNRSHYVRGQIISEAILLERLVDDYISRYFTDDSAKLVFMKEVVFGADKMVFEYKRQIFHEILKINNKDFLKTYPTLLKEISYIIEKRNNVAHLLIDIRAPQLDKSGIALVKHKNVTSEVYLDEEEIDNVLTTINRCVDIITKLIRIDYQYDYSHGLDDLIN